MSEASDIMAPDEEVTIRRGAQKLAVSELNWKAAKAFLKRLALHAPEFLAFDAAGNAQVDNGKLMGVLMGDLAEELVVATTGEPREFVEALSVADMAAVLDKSVELNLRPEMIDAAKNVMGRFRALMAKAT